MSSDSDAEKLGQQGIAFAKAQRLSQAMDCFDRALLAKPGWARAWEMKGAAAAMFGRLHEGIVFLEEAQKLGADSTNLLAQLRKKVAETQSSIAPNSAQAAEEWLAQGMALTGTERWDEAIVCLDRALAISPRVSKFWLRKAMVLSNARRLEAALECAEEARRLGDLQASQVIEKCRELMGQPRAHIVKKTSRYSALRTILFVFLGLVLASILFSALSSRR